MKKLGEWAVLLLVLAIPAGGVYYWQKASAAKRRAAMHPSAPAASASGMFQARGEAAPPTPGASTASTPLSASPLSTGPSAPAPTQDAPASAPAAAAAAPAAAELPVSSPTVAGLFSPKSDRDPTQSVAEKQALDAALAQAKLDREAAARAAEEERRRAIKKHPRIEDQITLQGVMEIKGQMTAIVNGDMVQKGQAVKGAKVVKIGESSVTFEYKGKFFTKHIKERKKR